MDVLSSSLKELEEAENEILRELSVLEGQTLKHLQGATALVGANGDRSGGINLFRHNTLDRADSSAVDSFRVASGSFRSQSLGKSDSGINRAVSLGERQEEGQNRDANTIASMTFNTSRSSIGLGDNFYRIESFGNRLKTIANESDSVLNKLKCAVSIVECVSVLYQSASKMVEFFTEMSGVDGSGDEYSGYEMQLGQFDGQMGDVLQLGAHDRFELSPDDRAQGDTKNMNDASPVTMAKRASLEKVNLGDSSKSMELLFEQVSRYIEQVELAKKNGYWNEALIVITKGYIGQVIASLKWAVLRYLSVTVVQGPIGQGGQVPSTTSGAQGSKDTSALGSTVTHRSVETQSSNTGTITNDSNSASFSANSGTNAIIQISERPKMLTRLAVCLGSEMEVFKCYLNAIRAKFPYSTSGSGSSASVLNKMTAGNEITLLKNTLKRARNALIYQANVVLSELGGGYYIQICREIHEHVSVEVASMFVDFVKVHFTPVLPASAPLGGAENSGDNAISNSVGGNVTLYSTGNTYSGTVNTLSGSTNAHIGDATSATLSSGTSYYADIGPITNNSLNNSSLNSFNGAPNSTLNMSPTTSSPSTAQVPATSYTAAGVSSRDTLSYGTTSGSRNSITSYSTNNPTSLANDTLLATHTTLNPRDNASNSHNSHSGTVYSNSHTTYNSSNNTTTKTNNSSNNTTTKTNNSSNNDISNHGDSYSSANITLYNTSTRTNLHNNIATNIMHQSSSNITISLESEALLSKLERSLKDENVLETIVSDSKYQTVLDTIAIMASLWSDFESALRDSTRPVYSKLNISLLSSSGVNVGPSPSNQLHGNNSTSQNINNTNLPPNLLRNHNNIYGSDGLVTLSLATKTLQSLLNAYVQLQHVFILKYVKQAIEVDAIYQSVSTLVDDVFFILQKSQQRSIGTGDLQTACATFNQTSAIIGAELKTALVGNLVESRSLYERWAQKLDNLSGSSVQSMLEEHFKKTRGSVPDSIASKHSFVHSLNNVEECLGLLEKFKQEMSECFSDRFFKEKQEKNLLIDNTIQTLDSVTTELEEILNTCCEYVFNILKDHLNDPLLKFGAIDFEMDDEKYSRSQNDESFADQLVSVLNIIFGHLSTNYTPKVALKCMTNLVEKLSKYLETSALSKRFTIYGAVYFDTAIRSLVYACSSYNQEIRKQFTTLLQISDVLNVNNRDDLMLLKESEYTIDISKYSGLRTDLTF